MSYSETIINRLIAKGLTNSEITRLSGMPSYKIEQYRKEALERYRQVVDAEMYNECDSMYHHSIQDDEY